MTTLDIELTKAQQKAADAHTRSEKLKRIIIVLGAGLAIIITTTVVGGIVLIRTTQQEGSPAVKTIIAQGKDQKELLEKVNSCTDPEGTCFKDAQARTGEALDTIQLGVIYAVTCGVNLVKDNPDAPVEEVQACVEALAKAQSEE